MAAAVPLIASSSGREGPLCMHGCMYVVSSGSRSRFSAMASGISDALSMLTGLCGFTRRWWAIPGGATRKRIDLPGASSGIDFQVSPAPDKRSRTPLLKGLCTHAKGGFFHDGPFSKLGEVVQHYNRRVPASSW